MCCATACRHLDLDGDGYISTDEVEALLAELGVPQSVANQSSHAREAPLSTQSSSAVPPSAHRITFAQFLQLHHQVY